MEQLAFTNGFQSNAVSPFEEMAAYEALWCRKGASFKQIADQFRASPNSRPSDFVDAAAIANYQTILLDIFKKYQVEDIGIRVNGTFDYPEKLRDSRNPLEVFYYQGWWDLAFSRSVAIVGSRKVSPEGIKRTQRLTKLLVENDFTITSGLADGVDAAAHKTAIECGGRTIGVIGTPLSHSYPKVNTELQNTIRDNFLLISQVPFQRYLGQDYRANRSFFPERNITMSALTEATIIVEASETSGTLYQARAAIAQNRKLFILDSCFNNPAITWPARFEKKGAIRVKEFDDVLDNLG